MKHIVSLKGISVFLLCGFLSLSAEEIPSLAQVFKGKFRFGFGGTNDQLVRTALTTKDPVITKIVEGQSNIIGINAFYPNLVHPRAGVWNWSNADALLAFADKHPGWPKRAHPLFWPFHKNNNLEWMLRKVDGSTVSRDEAVTILREYIRTVMGRYKGRFQYWDVINEAIDPSQPDKIRKGLWKDIIGPELIELTFRFAREADPKAKLFYNDYQEWQPAKRDAIIALVKGLKQKGLIDGLGLQAHMNMNKPSVKELDAALKLYKELGVEIHITELDIEVNPLGNIKAFTSELETAQAQRYKEIFDLYTNYAGTITAVMTWNVTDNSSWLLKHPEPHTTWPLLFDSEGKPKKAFWILVGK